MSQRVIKNFPNNNLFDFSSFQQQFAETVVLKRFLYSMYGDLDGAKRLLELNYTMRNKYPQIFLQRDPMDESSQRLLQVA